ncbi:ABC-type glycerol-3-phosphate transport system substrate-binding protein [Paenibacillus shirakamiensis]|uniref:ABC-type glycerol-3-phosphate transport system substrate-binding protein n=1 Tax=Paenibacillus shirakamiensis TaxID=1265935 RepID=A0ABS4JC01_9BACL|nr:ABC-type glycerol-3-phosphate transport system substrate-binding protein [Paenibacillus shirakamiensis]
MKRKNQWVLFAILLLALISLSPGEDSALIQPEDQGDTSFVSQPKQKMEEETGPIKVAVSLSPEEFERLKETNNTFMKEHHIQVDLMNIPVEQAYTTFKNRLALGDSPDVLLLDNSWIREFASKGFLLPSESYYSGQVGMDAIGSTLGQNEWNGYTWGIPKDLNPYTLVYNSKVLDSLGLKTMPHNTMEWSALLSKLKTNKTVPYMLGMDPADPYAFISLFWRLGNMNANKDTDMFALSAEARQALVQIQDMKFYNKSLGDEDRESQLLAKLAQREMLFAIVPRSTIISNPSRELIIELPEGGHLLWFEGRSYSVAAQTPYAKTANNWITAITSPSIQLQAFTEEGRLPTLKTLYTNADVANLREWGANFQIVTKTAYLPVHENVHSWLEQLSGLVSPFLERQTTLKEMMATLELFSQGIQKPFPSKP